MHSESLADVKTFLRDILVQERLSCSAEKERMRLLRFLDSRETSPAPYLEMNPNNRLIKEELDNSRSNECYEEFSSTNICNSFDNSCAKPKEKKSSSCRNSSSLYYNIAQAIRSTSSLDINDDRPILPHKELRNSLSTSSSTSNRDSISSFTTLPMSFTTGAMGSGSDSPDAISQISSMSNTCASPKNTDSSPEVLTVSASALRYSASKCGSLSRKEKFLFLDHYKQYWAALVGHTLYVYGSEKDSKPVLEVDIEGYQARPVGIKESNKKDYSFEIFCPGNKTYQFTASCALEMDQWISTICQAGKVPDTAGSPGITTASTRTDHHPLLPPQLPQPQPQRQLPSLPDDQPTYDMPDSAVRPVTPPLPEQYEVMNPSAEDDVFYHYISNDKCQLNQNVLYKNLEELSMAADCADPEKRSSVNENLYYNLIPPVDHDHDCIYDTIKEAKQADKSTLVSGRIQQIIQQIEAAASGNRSKHTSLIQDELYEPVSTPDEVCSGRTVSR